MAEENPEFFNLKFNKYEPPIFKEVKDGSLVLYGKNANDLYPDYLIDLYNKSTNHAAAVNAKIRYTVGGGWVVDSSVMSLENQAIYINYIKVVNESGDSLNDLTQKLAIDYYLQGAFAIEVIFGKTGKKWAGLNFVPISLVRALKVSENEVKYCYLPNWKGITKYDNAKTKDGFKEWYPFGSDKGSGSQLLYYRNFRPNKNGETDVYAQPSYTASIPWIEVDSRTGVFHLNNIRHNFTVGSLLNLFNGDPTPERRAQILAELKNHFAGENAEETGGVMVAFNKPGTTPATLDRLSAGDQDKLYLQVAEFARTGIFTAHNIPQSIMSIPVTGVMFSRDQINSDFEFFNNTLITPIRVGVFERTINFLMQYNGLQPLFRLKPVSVFQTGDNSSDENAKIIQALNSLAPSFANKVLDSMTTDEIRALVGLEPKVVSTTTKTNIQEFSQAQDIETLFTFDLAVTEEGELFTDEYYRTLHMAKVLDIKLTDFDADMLSVIQKNPTISLDALAIGLKKPTEKVQASLNRLIESGALVGSLGNLKISKVANNTIKEEDIALDIQVRYFYEGPNDSKTRDWCKERLANQPKNGYTFEQLQALKPSDANYDGNNFNNRGGFWTRKNTNDTTTYCRHKWVAKSVRIK